MAALAQELRQIAGQVFPLHPYPLRECFFMTPFFQR